MSVMVGNWGFITRAAGSVNMAQDQVLVAFTGKFRRELAGRAYASPLISNGGEETAGNCSKHEINVRFVQNGTQPT